MVTQNPNNKTTQDSPQKEIDHDFHGAAIIDEQGKEVPITEDMVKRACDELDKSSVYPERGNLQNPRETS